MKQHLATIVGWLVAVIMWLWAILPKALDWIGRSTLPDDWEALMAERLPMWAEWLFSTPGWVPALIAAALTGWLMWASRPQQFSPPAPLLQKSDVVGVDSQSAIEAEYLFARCVYVAQVRIGLKVSQRKTIDISIFCFNGNNAVISITTLRGQIIAKFQKSGEKIYSNTATLPPAHYSDNSIHTKIAPYSEFLVKIEQQVTDAVASALSDMKDMDRIWLDLSDLQIKVIKDNNPSDAIILPMWSAVTAHKDAERGHSLRVTTATLDAKFG